MFDARPLPTADPYERTDARALTTNLVLAQIVQNVLGGMGAGVALAAALWLMGVDLSLAWRWPVGIATLVAGASTAWRAYLDEFRADRRWHKREVEHSTEMSVLVELCDRLEVERDAARTDAQIAIAESNRLRNELFTARAQAQNERHAANQYSRGPVTLWSNEARADAAALLKLWYETKNWPGENVMGWPRNRQETARQLLQSAEIAPQKVYSKLAPPADYAWAEARLLAYFAKN